VIVGEFHEPDTSTLRANPTMETQKFLWRQQIAIRGKAIELPIMQTYAFVIRLRFSHLSLIIPPIIEDKKPHVDKIIAFETAYSFLKVGKHCWK
jgi:hypothetical protein